MLIDEIILEAGVKSAEVDRAARAAISQYLPKIVAALIKRAADDIGEFIDSDDGENRHQYYQHLHDWIYADQERALRPVLDELSRILTDVVEQFARRLQQTEIPQVNIEAREFHPDNTMSRFGGYFQQTYGGNRHKIVVRLDAQQVMDATLGAIQDEFFGESEGSRQTFLNTVVPTFAHEYVHYEQHVKGKDFFKSDLTYVTARSKRQRRAGQRKGKRGGFFRGGDNGLDTAKYLASTHEIDAWATSAASQLIGSLRQHYNGDEPYNFNSEIRDILRTISENWGSATGDHGTYAAWFRDLEQAYMREHIPKLMSSVESKKVWQRFLRMLYSKLLDYLHAGAGKTMKKLNPEWVAQAKTMPMAKMAAHLAMKVAHAALEKENWYLPWALKELSSGWNPDQRQAEDFIGDYYFGDYFDHEQQIKDYNAVFRRLTIKYLERLSAAHESQVPPVSSDA